MNALQGLVVLDLLMSEEEEGNRGVTPTTPTYHPIKKGK